MKTRAVFLAATLVFAVPLFGQTPNDQARFLAGLPPSGGPLEALSKHPAWVQHAGFFNKAWAQMESRQLAPARAWTAAKLPEFYGSTAPVFYFFSGPDFLYAETFFPKSSVYVLCGIEPVGTLPDATKIDPAVLTLELDGLRHSLNTMMTTHYFITKEMRTDLTRTRLGGTLPLLYVFLARTGCTIRDVKMSANNVRIDFTGPGGAQTLYYFKTDLANGGSNGSFLAYCREIGPGMSLLKSASYLLHTGGFSKTKQFLLDHSRVILQDDSGIPYRDFPAARWDVKLYGAYVRHGDMFGKYFQTDLDAAYSSGSGGPLGFSLGYHWQKERGIAIVARPK